MAMESLVPCFVDLKFSAKIELNFRIRWCHYAFSCAGCCPDVRYFGEKVVPSPKDRLGWILPVASRNLFHPDPKINTCMYEITLRIHNNSDSKIFLKQIGFFTNKCPLECL